MKYINPITFLEPETVTGNSVADKRSLLLQKKKLLAEIELSEDKTVLINDSLLTKNDLLNLFEELQSGEVEFHLAIARDRTLSAFLQDKELSGGFINAAIYKDSDFIEFVSPYYEEIFTKRVLAYFRDLDVGRMKVLFSNPLLLDGVHQEKSFAKIMRYLVVKKHELLQVKNESVNKRKAYPLDFEPFVGENFILLINTLPNEFYGFRGEYGLELINTGIAIQKINLKLAVNMLAAVKLLNCDEYIHEQNDERYEILSENLRAKPSIQWRWVWVGFIILRILYSVDKCGKSDSSSFNNNFDYNIGETGNNKVNAGYSFFREKHKLGTEFVSALSNYSGDPDNFKGKGLYETPVVKSGTDVYKALFNSTPFRLENGGIVIPGYDDGKAKERMREAMYKERVFLENKTSSEAIAIVQTSDSIFTSYVQPNDTASFVISNGVNAVFFYLGNNWDPKKELKQSLYENGDSSNAIKLKGVFRSVSPVTVKYLNEPFWLTVDNSVSSTQDRRSFFTIKMDGSYPSVEFETLSSQRIKMERGYFSH